MLFFFHPNLITADLLYLWTRINRLIWSHMLMCVVLIWIIKWQQVLKIYSHSSKMLFFRNTSTHYHVFVWCITLNATLTRLLHQPGRLSKAHKEKEKEKEREEQKRREERERSSGYEDKRKSSERDRGKDERKRKHRESSQDRFVSIQRQQCNNRLFICPFTHI